MLNAVDSACAGNATQHDTNHTIAKEHIRRIHTSLEHHNGTIRKTIGTTLNSQRTTHC
jgi:class 3 adenylate cyclase